MTDYLHYTFDADDPGFVDVVDELPLWSAPFGLALLDAVRLRPGLRVLDVGCGLGFPAQELAMRLGATGCVVALDPWSAALGRLRTKRTVLGLRNLDVVRGAAEHLPFADARFDLLVSNNGINNVAEPLVTLAECARVARPDAQFVLTYNLDGTMREFYDVFAQVLDRRGPPGAVAALREHIGAKRPPLARMESWLASAGFRSCRAHTREFHLDFVDGSTMFAHGLVKHWFLGSWKALVADADRVPIFAEVEAEINRRARTGGGWRLTVPFAVLDCVR